MPRTTALGDLDPYALHSRPVTAPAERREEVVATYQAGRVERTVCCLMVAAVLVASAITVGGFLILRS